MRIAICYSTTELKARGVLARFLFKYVPEDIHSDGRDHSTFVDRHLLVRPACFVYKAYYHGHTGENCRAHHAAPRYNARVMFPSSVEQVTLTRTKQGQQKTRPKFLPGHDTPLDPNEPEADVGVGGAILDIGRDGAARLDNAKGLWGWDWIKRIESSGSMIQTGEGVLLYPRNRSLDPEVTSLPPTKIANAAVSSRHAFTRSRDHELKMTGRLRSSVT